VQLELADLVDTNVNEVRNFLQKYMNAAHVNVYWGSTAQFIAELREHWEV
jgi:hypothetical protein